MSRTFTFFYIALIICNLVSVYKAHAVTAYPNQIEYKQPDGSVITVQLQGDEYVHWATTTDGYTIMTNAEGTYEYAMTDNNGYMVFSGIQANDPNERSIIEINFLNSINPGIFFSDKQLREIKDKCPIKPKYGEKIGGFPTTGIRNLIMILSNFSDTSPTYTQAQFDNYMNQVNYNGTGSFRDYFIEASYGQLTVNTTVTTWVTLPNIHDYYGPAGKWGEFAYASCVAANPIVNFALYDNDANGTVDGIAIIHQGRGQEESGNPNDIWSHSWDLASAGYTVAQRTMDGVLIYAYTTMPERNATGMGTIGVMCHEFGHNLGSPDFYDTDYGGSGGEYDGTGYWDLMASGSWNGGGWTGTKPAHPNPYVKCYIYGWATPTLLTVAQSVTVNNSTFNSNSFYRYDTPTANEYFLIENKQQTGFDVGCIGHGMLIYHVDGSYITSHTNTNDINVGSHQGLYPMSATSTTANGIMLSSGSTINSAGCPWPGTGAKVTFTDGTTPWSRSWAGANTNKPLTTIAEAGGVVTFCFISCGPTAGPIQVTATAGTLGPTDYPTLKDAFDAINAGTHQGAITVKVLDNTTETATASLNASGSGAANYTSVTMYPTVTGKTISGNLAAPLINLNGADNVIIDGRVNMAGATDLTISNTSASNAAGTSTICFINDAVSNIVKYCNLLGAETDGSSGIVYFSTASTAGNDNNTVDNCNITNAGTRPINAISSSGTAGMENNGITISNNKIYNFFNPGNTSNGIYIPSNSTDFTISGNSFYETASFAPTAGNSYTAINISNVSGNNFTVSGNYIGGSAASCAGTFTKTNAQNNGFTGISLNVGTATASNIQGNTIRGFSWSNSGNAAWFGINITAGAVNIGTTSGNTIGAATGIGSVRITNSTTLGSIYGIYSSSNGTVNIQNNTIGSFNTGGGAAIGYYFYGIWTTNGINNISNNTIGSTTTTNSVSVGAFGVTTATTDFTGIRNDAANPVTISSNTIQNCSVYGTGVSSFRGISLQSGTGTVNINSNNIIGCSIYGTNTFTCIETRAAVATLNINFNIFRNDTIKAATCPFYGIYNDGVVTTAINMNNNQLGNALGGLVIYSIASSNQLTGIRNWNGAATCALSISNNNFQGIVNSIAGSHNQYYIFNSAATLSQNISNNTFTNLNVNTTGEIHFIDNSVTVPAGGTQIINGNSIVTGFNETGSANLVYIIFSNAAQVAGSTITWNNNNFSNLTVTGITGVYGFYNAGGGAGASKTFNNNVFTNWSGGTNYFVPIVINWGGALTINNNTINNISCNNQIMAIDLQSSGTSGSISGNTISALSSGGAFTVTGIRSASPNGFISKNKIYDLSNSNAGGTVYGIQVTAGNHTISNNRIGDLRTTAATSANPTIIGINITSASANTTVNVYYNSIYINGTSSGANFGSSGIFHTSSGTATTAALNLRNNIIVNTSTPSGTGLTTALRRSAVTLSNYQTTSNNNLFYAGTPGASRLIYYDGTNSYQTLAAFKAAVTTRETLSITENPPFISTSGLNVNFLKINTTIGTLVESGAVNIATFTDDYDGDIRQGNAGYAGTGTAPDIGSDEFEGTNIITLLPINVSAANPLSNGDYATLKAAFDAINAQVQTGFNIIIKVNGSTIETMNAVLNAGAWNSVLMYPTASGLTISSSRSTSGNAELIDLDGADNVTIDGRVNLAGAADLSLIHTGTDNSSRNIRFINSAENNTVKYCKIRGACPSSGAGIIFFSTASAGNGNDNNTIDNCDITNSGTRPFNVISSIGSAGFENSGNIISNNKIYDFFHPSAPVALASYGIFLQSSTTAWTITGNSFYETTSLAPTAAVDYSFIRIFNAAGVNFTISGNYFGGSAVLCGGSALTKTNSQNNVFNGIFLNVGTAAASNIQGNTIQNFSWLNSGNATWSGININAGSVNIGTTSGNIIGSGTGNNSIIINNSVTNGMIYGIYSASTGTLNIQNNSIGSFSAEGAAAIGYVFYGIFTSGAAGNYTISANTIGSTTSAYSNSIGKNGITTATTQFSGIYNTASGTISITGNTIQNCSSFGTGASVYYGIYNTNGSGTIDINSNNIIESLLSGTSVFRCIYNGIGASTININSNVIRNNNKTQTTGEFYAIHNSGAATTAININNNQLGNASGGLISYSAGNNNNLYGIYNNGGTGTCNLTISGNDFQGISLSAAGSSPHTYIYNSAATLSQNISNNTFTNLIANTTGTVTFISNGVAVSATGTQTVNNNSIVTGFSKIADGGSVRFFSGGTSVSGAIITHSSNNFSNVTIPGSTGIQGWITSFNYGLNFTGNTFSNWNTGTGFLYGVIINGGGATSSNTYSNNTFSNITSGSAIYVMQIITSSGNFGTITSNTFNTMSCAGTIIPITPNLTGTSGGNITRNKMYDLASSNSVWGIWMVAPTPGGSVTNIFNNRIADLKTTAGGSSTSIVGIYISGGAVNGQMNIYYNTIYLNATTAGANLGTCCIYHTYNATSTTDELFLRNNILVNVSTPKGSGRSIVFQRTAATDLNNYNLASNNNIMYAGVPGPNNLIYMDGTNFDQNIADFRARVYPRELWSKTEIPPFLSTLGSSPNFLKIDPLMPTQVESGAVNIATYVDDFEGDIRQGNPGYVGTGTAPDIGADEFNGTVASLPINVSGAHIGSNGDYATLKLAFDAINAFSQTGNNVVVKVKGSTTEILSASLRAGTWTSLIVYPTVSGLSITGNINGPLVDLSGANNVTIDGRVNMSGSTTDLTFSNTSTSNIAGTSTVRFINDASADVVKYCYLKGAETTTISAVVFFSTASAGSGNDNNTIDKCFITNSGSRPYNAVYSSGTIGKENSGNVISNNNIYDFFTPAATSNGIYLSTATTDWTVAGNSFYETTSLAPTAAGTYSGIYIYNSSGNNFTISGNYIGGNAALGSGIYTKTNSQNNTFYGIYLYAGNVTASNIQGNTVRGFSWLNSANANWAGIYSSLGLVNIGTTASNTVGATTGTGSISVVNGTTGGTIYGLFANTTSTANIQNNNVGSITAGGAAGIAYNFYGINNQGSGNFVLSGNLIGSTLTASSISVGINGVSTAASTFVGLFPQGTGTISITGNTVQNCSNNGTGGSTFYGIYNAGGTGSIDINSNNVKNCFLAGTSIFFTICNTASSTAININSNVLQDNTKTGTSGTFYGIYNTGSAAGNTINITGNSINNISYTTAVGGVANHIFYNQGNATTLNITNNTIQNYTYTSTGAGSFSLFTSAGTLTNLNITNNAFTNINAGVPGGSFNGFAPGNTTNLSISLNTINGLSQTSSALQTFMYVIYPTSASISLIDIFNNNFNGYSNAWGPIYGVFSSAATPTRNIYANTFSNFTSATYGGGGNIWAVFFMGGVNINVYNNIIHDFNTTGSTGTGTNVRGIHISTNNTSESIYGNEIYNLKLDATNVNGTVEGITTESSPTGNKTIYQNNIHDLSCASGVPVYGINQRSGGATITVYKNKISDLSCSGTSGIVYGYYTNGGTSVIAYNNRIGNLSTPTSTNSNAVNGVYIGGGTSVKLYYNSVYLNASSTGATFGSSGIYTNSGPTVELINNIIVNNSTPGSGRTVAHRRSSTVLGTLAASTNNNLLYAGTPGASNLIFYDGFNSDQTLLAYKTRVAMRESMSVTELPPFLSTIGSNANFLKIDPTVSTQVESGAVNIATFTDDFEGDIRFGNAGYAGTGTRPDIGADEFDGIHVDTWYGITSTDFNTASNWRCNVVPVFGASVVFDVKPFNHCLLDIDRTINNLTNAQLTYDMFPNSHKLTILGSLIFSGGAQIDDQVAPSKVEFAGTVAQVMPAGCFVNNTVNDLIINNSSGVSMGGVGNITVNGTLTLTSGILTTGANTMDLNTLGTVVETPIAPTSYVLGNLKATRNIGGAVNQTFGGIGLEINEPGVLNSTVVTRVTGTTLFGNPPCCTANPSIRRYFDISPTTNTGLNASMTYKYFDWEIAGFTEANLKLYKAPLPYNPVNPLWVEQLMATVSPVNNWLTLNGIASFSRWTAADYNAPLPVELISFDGKLEGDKARLFWVTASETNNDYFTVEKSTDGINWTVLGFVDGAGSSNQILNYEFYDYTLVPGIQYYRLKQTDFNGSYGYSEIVNINYLLNDLGEIMLYPNPTDGEFNLFVKCETDEIITVRLMNAVGQLIWEKGLTAGIKQVFNIEDQPNGVYYLEVKNDQNIKRFKLVKD
jgi:M6 family metalloprotease-like protein